MSAYVCGLLCLRLFFGRHRCRHILVLKTEVDKYAHEDKMHKTERPYIFIRFC